ncbi:rRNA-processing protein fcf2-like [Rutidosis leptorrhynchoides]|uniref:rRNA-processing protein fcf2-like n=1 Tax=Rutidosis leptorrhynchoides TaxID=125765 RepID=UPI003A997F71
MAEKKAEIGVLWEPKLPILSSLKKSVSDNNSKLQNQAESSVLWRPSTELVDGLFVPPNDPKKVNKLLRKQVKDTAGNGWFDMPAPTITPELKRDLELLKLRGAMDPKRFYKKAGSKSKALPKYFQVGTVIQSHEEFYSGRLSKKERKETLADELLSDSKFKQYRKRKVREIEEKSRPGGNEKWKNKKPSNWLKAKRRKPMFIPSMTGLNPVMAALIPIPVKEFSATGVSRTLRSPNFFAKSFVTLYEPP